MLITSLSKAISTTRSLRWVLRGWPTQAGIAALLHRFGTMRAMLMYAPSDCNSRNNYPGLVSAYVPLPHALRTTHRMVIFSKLKATVLKELLTHADTCGLARHEMILTGYVDDDTLIALYQAATLFGFPPSLMALACLRMKPWHAPHQ